MCAEGYTPERLESTVSFLRPWLVEKASILEIGCSTGDLGAALYQAGCTSRYIAVEMSPAAFEAAKKINEVHRLPLPDCLGRFVYPDSVDMVIMANVLEHIPDLHAELTAISEVLRENGRLFIEVPNGSGNRALPFDDNSAHHHFFSPSSLTRLLAMHGFQSLEVTTGIWMDDRYSDVMRVMAQKFHLPSAIPRLALDRSVIVWGAGDAAKELINNFMDTARVLFFVDIDKRKWGTSVLGSPVHPPAVLAEWPDVPVLIGSVQYEDSILRTINANRYDVGRDIILLSHLLREAA